MGYHVRLMKKEDIPQVTGIDREAFPTQWPPASYYHELQNMLARYIVITDDSHTVSLRPQAVSRNIFARLFRREKELPEEKPMPLVLGFAGFWMLSEEAHITTIAVREKFRGQGIGELLMSSLINLAVSMKARLVTLEVRTSNSEAKNLYLKYGFVKNGVRRGYYTDNREDADIMTLDRVASPEVQVKLRHLGEALGPKWGEVRYEIPGIRESPARPAG